MTRLHNEQQLSGHFFEKRGLQDGLDMERTIHVLIQSMFFHDVFLSLPTRPFTSTPFLYYQSERGYY